MGNSSQIPLLSVEQAKKRILQEARLWGSERIPLEKAYGRVLAQDAVSDRDYPPFNRAAMDGFAVMSSTYTRAKNYSILCRLLAGDGEKNFSRKTPAYLADKAVKIMTGAAVPAPFDTLVRREDAKEENGLVSFTAPTQPAWQHIARRGEDIKKGARVSLRGQRIGSAQAALLASLGIVRPLVSRLPVVEIVTTGKEVVNPRTRALGSKIRNANLYILQAQLSQYAITPSRHSHATDSGRALQRALKCSAVCDLLIITGGVSAGDTDRVPQILETLGYRKLFHKVAVKPGKPLWFGKRGKTAAFALPGNPLSVQVSFRVFVEPYLRACLGLPPIQALYLPLKTRRSKNDLLAHYFLAKLTRGQNGTELAAIEHNSSGDITAGIGADGLILHPAEKLELQAGTIVEFLPWRLC